MRLFIAINFDEATKKKLIAIQDNLKTYSKGNYTRPENLHLTILFLGEVSDYSAVKKSMDANFHSCIDLVFDRVGKFRNSIYWVGIRDNPILNELYNNLCRDLKREGYKVDWNERFSPHVTLARKVVMDKQPDLSFKEFTMTAKRISLMKSERINGRLVYTELYGKTIG